ncbi:hypothetical protein HK102_011160, partial [Quaeritorhiza haematococci]
TLAYSDIKVFLICFAIDSEDSFKNAFEKWVPEVQAQEPNAKIVVVGTKTDIRKQHQPTMEEFMQNNDISMIDDPSSPRTSYSDMEIPASPLPRDSEAIPPDGTLDGAETIGSFEDPPQSPTGTSPISNYITTERLIEAAAAKPGIFGFHEVSAKTGMGLQNVFDTIVEAYHAHGSSATSKALQRLSKIFFRGAFTSSSSSSSSTSSSNNESPNTLTNEFAARRAALQNASALKKPLAPWVAVSPSCMSQDFAWLLTEEGRFCADVEFRSHKGTWKRYAHRVVLCCASRVFRRIFGVEGGSEMRLMDEHAEKVTEGEIPDEPVLEWEGDKCVCEGISGISSVTVVHKGTIPPAAAPAAATASATNSLFDPTEKTDMLLHPPKQPTKPSSRSSSKVPTTSRSRTPKPNTHTRDQSLTKSTTSLVTALTAAN